MGRAPTRSQQAYEHIRRELIRGRWAVGDSVSAYALAEEIGVSRTPVVEALKRIEAEGLVEIVPQVGCRIIAPSPSSLEELFGLRRALEGMAARAAATAATEEDMLRIDGLLRRFEEAVAAGELRACDEADRAFHLAIAAASGLGQVTSMSEGVWSLLPARRAVPSEEELAEHEEIRAALHSGAGERARVAAERHVAHCAAQETESAPPPGPGGQPDHTALVYASEEEFLATAVPFLAAGVTAGERVLAVTGPRNRELLVSGLGADAGAVIFEEDIERYRTPGDTLHGYQRYVAENSADARVRLLGEPIWEGRTTTELGAWIRYESLLNVAFATLPVSVLCPYSASALNEEIIRGARCTHPQVCAGGVTSRSDDYVSPLAFPG